MPVEYYQLIIFVYCIVCFSIHRCASIYNRRRRSAFSGDDQFRERLLGSGIRKMRRESNVPTVPSSSRLRCMHRRRSNIHRSTLCWRTEQPIHRRPWNHPCPTGWDSREDSPWVIGAARTRKLGLHSRWRRHVASHASYAHVRRGAAFSSWHVAKPWCTTAISPRESSSLSR